MNWSYRRGVVRSHRHSPTSSRTCPTSDVGVGCRGRRRRRPLRRTFPPPYSRRGVPPVPVRGPDLRLPKSRRRTVRRSGKASEVGWSQRYNKWTEERCKEETRGEMSGPRPSTVPLSRAVFVQDPRPGRRPGVTEDPCVSTLYCTSSSFQYGRRAVWGLLRGRLRGESRGRGVRMS